MNRKFFEKIFVAIMVLSLSTSINVSAAVSEADDLVETPPTSVETLIQSRGASAPTSSADTHDLLDSSYSYKVTKVGYRVYTSKWLTGAKKIKVIVQNWNLIADFGGTSNKLTVSVYDSNGDVVDSESITITSSGSVTLSGLSASKKYYVCFKVPNNTNKYAFNGTISKVS